MFSKLAFNNVKKSFSDYTVYFLTLTFGICIFYIFNSIQSQQAMLIISESQRDILKILTQTIGYVSVFISVILGFLIVYANQFLIKRRKKELGIYMTLGMNKGKISKILILETLIIGVASLVFGLISGVFISQGLSVVTASILEVDMREFTFIFSKSAFMKSILYFGVSYMIVIIFNTLSITKFKLIDLIYAHKKNENFKLQKIWLSVVIFIFSMICLMVAYYLILENGMLKINIQFGTSVLLGIMGTLLFFMSVSGFLLRIVQSNHKLYFKNLNMFILRQLNSKINTNFLTMTVICLMLFITIGALSTGLAMSSAIKKEVTSITPFDATIQNRAEDNNSVSIVDKLEEDGLDLEKIAKNFVEAKIYKTEIKYSGFTKDYEINKKNDIVVENIEKQYVPVVSLTEFNKILKLQGLNAIILEENEFAINCNYSDMVNVMDYYLSNNGTFKIGERELRARSNKIFSYVLATMPMKLDFGTIVVKDDLLINSELQGRVLNIQYATSDGSSEKLLKDEIKRLYNVEKPYNHMITKKEVYEQSTGMTAIMTYLAIYIGIVFLITSAAVLALQQLSEAADNIQRYSLLRKLGAEKKMINNALFVQLLIYFMMPLSLAIVHSIVGIKVANSIVVMFGNINILSNIIVTALLFLVVYGGYFFATYISSKNIICNRNNSDFY